MLSDIDNLRKMAFLLGDEGFVDALTRAEELVDETEETLGRVEEIEADAERAVREANETLQEVDRRLDRVDRTIRNLEAKIEAGFSVAFFFFALNRWIVGDPFLAVGLFVLGLMGASALVVTIVRLPHVRRLRRVSEYVAGKLGRVADDGHQRTTDGRTRNRTDQRTTDGRTRGRPGRDERPDDATRVGRRRDGKRGRE